MKYLITGSTGFLGKNICSYFDLKQINYTSCVRVKKNKNDFETRDLIKFSDWDKLFEKIDVVIHSAAKAHDMSKSPGLTEIYTEVNFNLTIRLAENAKKHGVKRFVFISTIKVNDMELLNH